jgi:hypothetical protein
VTAREAVRAYHLTSPRSAIFPMCRLRELVTERPRRKPVAFADSLLELVDDQSFTDGRKWGNAFHD